MAAQGTGSNKSYQGREDREAGRACRSKCRENSRAADADAGPESEGERDTSKDN